MNIYQLAYLEWLARNRPPWWKFWVKVPEQPDDIELLAVLENRLCLERMEQTELIAKCNEEIYALEQRISKARARCATLELLEKSCRAPHFPS